jgi:hypothetical protein
MTVPPVERGAHGTFRGILDSADAIVRRRPRPPRRTLPERVRGARGFTHSELHTMLRGSFRDVYDETPPTSR